MLYQLMQRSQGSDALNQSSTGQVYRIQALQEPASCKFFEPMKLPITCLKQIYTHVMVVPQSKVAVTWNCVA